jgi:hypothetical protein
VTAGARVWRLRKQTDLLEDLLCGVRGTCGYHRRLSDIKDRSRRLSPFLLRPSIDRESPHPCESVALYDDDPIAGIHILLKDLIAGDIAGIESATSICQPGLPSYHVET